MEQVEVGIIGGGVHGASAAFHIVRRGVKTRLFERWAPAGGPTGRSSAICRAYYTNDFLARVARDSLQMFRDFTELTGGRDSGYRATGALYLHPPEDVDRLQQSVAHLNEIGTQVDLINVDDLASAHPGFDFDGVAMGAWEATAGYADPVSTTAGLFDRAVDLGLDARLYCQVDSLQVTSGGGALVVTADGAHTHCERLLIAAGPWTGRLAAQVGALLPLTVERHLVATFGWGAGDRIPFVLADLPNEYYLKPEGRDLFIVGALHPEPPADPDNFDQNTTQAEVRAMAAGVTRRVPGLYMADSRGGWASVYDVSPDWQPVIGEIADGVFVDAGTSGHGFKLAPGLGAHLADLVLGGDVDPGLAQFHPRRFEENAQLNAGYGTARILG